MEYGNEMWFIGAYVIGTVVGYWLFSRTQIEKTVYRTLCALDDEGVIALDRETGDITPVYREDQYDDLLDKIMQDLEEYEREKENKGKDEDRL